MKYQALFSSKDKVKKIKVVLSAAILLGPLRVHFQTYLDSCNSFRCSLM